MNDQKTTSNDLLWHYTTPEGLIGIIEDNSLWATDVFYLNDSAEFMHGINIARGILKNIVSPVGVDETKRLNRFDTDLSFIGPDHNRTIYVCSLSEAKDELSQWRAYCQGGGFAIGFPCQGIVNAIQGKHFELKKCVYDSNEQKEVIENLIDLHVIPYVKNPQQFQTIPCTEQEISAVVCGGSNKFQWELYSTCSTLKHPSFEREAEWRLVYDHRRPFNEIKPMFRAKNGLIIPHTSIKLPTSEDFWRKVRIIIGPTKYKKELKGSVHGLFRKHHEMAISITHSKTPFREL